MVSFSSRDGRGADGLLRFLCLLFFAGLAMRLTLLAVPPVIPLIHEELHMSETQIGLLIGLPLAVLAVAAVPGSLLIARVGARFAVVVGMIIAAFAGAARGAAFDVFTLYLAAIVAGFGIALMQPGLPTLVREWLPARVALGTAAYSSGMVVGATLPPVLTIPSILPLVDGSWRLAFVFWAVPAIIIPIAFYLLTPRGGDHEHSTTDAARRSSWWPNWKNPLIWLVGFAFGCNNSPFFATNAFLGDFLISRGQTALVGWALGWLNGAQILALIVVLFGADRMQRRAWPFLVFGPMMLAAFIGLVFVPTPLGLAISCGCIGIATAVTMTATLALPPLLSAPGDVARVSAGMFTISYTCAIIVPAGCGALWDMSGKPWTVFILPCLCAVGLTVLGTIAARFRPTHERFAPSAARATAPQPVGTATR